MKKFKVDTVYNNQQGFVAFFVTIMVMIIFGILILSFSQISNREGVSALNRDLSTNALYAAESGINDAYTTIRNEINSSSSSGSGGSSGSSGQGTPTTFNYTGSTQTYTVPTGITSLNVTLYGGASGEDNYGDYFAGGETAGTLTVTPGEVLSLIVAGSGGSEIYSGAIASGGYGGGGASGGGTGGSGAGGGGASEILNGSTPLAIAGGAGGVGGNGGGAGGTGGGTTGGNGGTNSGSVSGGTGGTQSSGGTGTHNGTEGVGGAGGAPTGSFSGGGGGGGGGYYGGGGGSGYIANPNGGGGGGGGGGSSLVPSGGTTTSGGASSINAAESGNGEIIVTPVTATCPTGDTGTYPNCVAPPPPTPPTQQTTSCDPSTFGNPILDSYDTQYTCVLDSISPSTLSYSCPGFCANNTIVTEIQSSGNPINNLTIGWNDPNIAANTGCSTQNPLPFFSYSNWPTNCLEVLRVDLVPFVSGTTTLSTLESGDKTFFLYPQSSAVGTENFAQIDTSNQGTVYPANCSSQTSCSFTIQGLAAYSTTFYARVQYYYGTSPSINFNGTDINNLPISFSSSQLQIDATGLSGTVLKRVSASIDLDGSDASPYSLPLPPNDALQSKDSICKSFLIYQNNLYEVIPSNKPGDITSAISPATEINTTNNSDFCDPI